MPKGIDALRSIFGETLVNKVTSVKFVDTDSINLSKADFATAIIKNFKADKGYGELIVEDSKLQIRLVQIPNMDKWKGTFTKTSTGEEGAWVKAILVGENADDGKALWGTLFINPNDIEMFDQDNLYFVLGVFKHVEDSYGKKFNINVVKKCVMSPAELKVMSAFKPKGEGNEDGKEEDAEEENPSCFGTWEDVPECKECDVKDACKKETKPKKLGKKSKKE